MRARWPPLVALVGFAVAVVPALASNQSVDAGPGIQFSSATVTVNAGESVTWTNKGGNHSVVFDDPSVKPFSGNNNNGAPDTSAWTATGTFPNAGTFAYRCGFHTSSMFGTVVVNGAGGSTGTTTTTTTTPTTTTPAPTPTIDRTPPSLANVTPTARSFCSRAGGRCKVAGVTIELTTSEMGTIDGTLKRRPKKGRTRTFRAFGTVRFTVRIAGDNRFRFTKTAEGRRLAAGSYRLTLRALDVSENRSRARTVSFTVR